MSDSIFFVLSQFVPKH